MKLKFLPKLIPKLRIFYHYFFVTKQENEIANEYEKLSLDAAQWKDREIYSVTKVQSVYRGWKTRCKINRWQRAGRQIQRVFRGHQGRIRFKGKIQNL